MVTSSSLERTLGERLTIHFLPALFFLSFFLCAWWFLLLLLLLFLFFCFCFFGLFVCVFVFCCWFFCVYEDQIVHSNSTL